MEGIQSEVVSLCSEARRTRLIWFSCPVSHEHMTKRQRLRGPGDQKETFDIKENKTFCKLCGATLTTDFYNKL